MTTDDEPPFLRVVRGNPTPEEIAAVIAALLAWDGGAAASPVRAARSAWGDPAQFFSHPRHPHPHSRHRRY